MAAKRLTRKEIVQQDAIGKTLTETSHWAVENIKYIVAAAAIVILVALATFVWRTYSESRNAELQTAFGDALAMYHAPIVTPEEASETAEDGQEAEAEQQGPTAEDLAKYKFATEEEKFQKALAAFEDIAERFGGSRLGDLAVFYAALSQNELGQTEAGSQGLKDLVSRSSYADVRNLARNSMAQTAYEAGDVAGSIQLLGEILNDDAANFPKQIILMRLAQTYEAQGDLQSALENYRRVTAEFEGTPSANQAASKVTDLETRTGVKPATEESEPETPAETEE